MHFLLELAQISEITLKLAQLVRFWRQATLSKRVKHLLEGLQLIVNSDDHRQDERLLGIDDFILELALQILHLVVIELDLRALVLVDHRGRSTLPHSPDMLIRFHFETVQLLDKAIPK